MDVKSNDFEVRAKTEAAHLVSSRRPASSKFSALSEEHESSNFASDAMTNAAASSSGAKSKKRTKKKAKKSATAAADIDDDVLLDEAIRAVRIDAAISSSGASQCTSALKVDYKMLDAETELKQLIGKHMAGHSAHRSAVSKQDRNARTIGRIIKMRQGWPPLRTLGMCFFFLQTLKTNQIRSTIARFFCSGLELEQTKSANELKWFRIRHNTAYQNQIYIFTTLRKVHDYESIMVRPKKRN